MNRRGEDLKENVPGIIIAVLGLVIIVAAVWISISAYKSQDERKAQNLVNNLEGKLNVLPEGQISKFAVVGVQGWFIAGWSSDDPNRPQKCALESCICVCKEDFGASGIKLTDLLGYRPAMCQSKGFCRFFKDSNVNVNIFVHSQDNNDVQYLDKSIIEFLNARTTADLVAKEKLLADPLGKPPSRCFVQAKVYDKALLPTFKFGDFGNVQYSYAAAKDNYWFYDGYMPFPRNDLHEFSIYKGRVGDKSKIGVFEVFGEDLTKCIQNP
jgi:hypothetical protein